MAMGWRVGLSSFVVLVAMGLAMDACHPRARLGNMIELFNRSGEELTYVAEERDHDAIGDAPPEVVLQTGGATSWIVGDGNCLEGTVEARDAEGNVVASWDQPCGRDQLRVDPPGEPLGAG